MCISIVTALPFHSNLTSVSLSTASGPCVQYYKLSWTHLADADLDNNLNYGESFNMLNCNLYLRSIRSKGAQGILLAIYCFVLFFFFFFLKCFFYFYFSFCSLFRPKIGFQKNALGILSIKQANKQKGKLFQLAALPIQMNWKGTKLMIAFSLCCVYFDVCGH